MATAIPVFDGADPGAAAPSVDNEATNTLTRPNYEWVTAKTRGRWAPFWNQLTRRYNPPKSERRDAARKKKYAWSHLTTPGDPAYVPLHLCMTGDEVLAERARIRGDGTSFRTPRSDAARELVALLPHGRLRPIESLLLVVIAYAMLERRRHGLVATVAELAELVGMRATATSEALARLVALGFVRSDATYTRYGACCSQRGNLWRLTSACVEAFALRDVPDGVALPAGTVDRDRLQRRRRAAGIGSATRAGAQAPTCATPRNPDPIPDALSKQENNPESFRNGHRTDVARGKVSASRTVDFRRAVPAAGADAPWPARRQDETCRPSLRLRTERVASSAACIVEELAELVSDPVARAAILEAARAKKGGAS